MKNYFYMTMIFALVISCKYENRDEHKSITNIKHTLNVDTVFVSIPSTFYDKYNKATSTYINGRKYIIGINPSTYDANFVDLDGDSCFSVNMERRGPNGIPMIAGINCIDDCILIKGVKKYYWIDYWGHVLDKTDLRKYNGIDSKKYLPSRGGGQIVNFDNIVYDVYNNIVYESLVTLGDMRKDDYYNSVFIAQYNIDEKKSSFLPFKYPEILKEDFWGYRDKAFVSLGENEDLIINFPFSSKIWCFKNKEKLLEFTVNSEYTDNLSKPSDYKRFLDHPLSMIGDDLKSLRFLPIKYDEYKNLYYRIHVDKAKGELEKRFKNRRLFFSIISSSFEKLFELELPKGISESDFFIFEDGVYFQMPTQTSKAHTHMRLLKFTF